MRRNELISCRANRSQSEIANELGITQKHLSMIELGSRNPSISIAAKFCKLYEESAEKLFPDIFLTQNTTKKSIKK